MIIRHPEKVNKPINPIKKKPSWIKSKLTNSQEFFLTKSIVNQYKLKTVCQEANCPNITECWSKRHATFLILYFFFNLLDGVRGLFSYIKKKEILKNLQQSENNYIDKIENLEFKNSLLTTNLDLDYIETLIRSKFFFGKKEESVYIITNDN